MKSLAAEIKPSDLHYMHDTEGLTQAEIADKLGVSIVTVRRYMNLDPGTRCTKRNRSTVSRKAEQPSTTPAPSTFGDRLDDAIIEKRAREKLQSMKPQRLQELSKIIDLKGSLCDFRVDVTCGEITLHNGTIEGTLTRDTISDLVADLNDLLRVFH